MSVLARAVRSAQWLTVSLVAYDAALALAGWAQPVPPSADGRGRRFRVLVPAHDEAHVLAGVLGDLRAQAHDARLTRVVVIADRCIDATAAVARDAGVEAFERKSGAEGKGAALSDYLAQHPLAPDEAVVVLDADTRLPTDVLSGFAAALSEGSTVLQANLDVSNPDASLLATASAVSYWSGNRMVQHARSVLGWSADLGGTGMCITAEALESAGGFSVAFAEDRDLALRVLLSGSRVRWLHTVRILDEKPTAAAAAVRQRARWRNADRDVRRRHLGTLLRYAAAERSGSAADHALRMVRPGRAVLVGLSALPTALSLVRSAPWLLPRRVWAPALATQLLLPPAFLARDGVARRHVLLSPAALCIAALALPVQVVAPRVRGRWVHTPHLGEPPVVIEE